jgi:hypothetical protein
MPASTSSPAFEPATAHRHFAVECFNRVWALIDKVDRTPDEDEAMVLCATASLWHWTQRPDCTARNLSIGHWQVSRVHALVGHGGSSMRHARRSLELAEGSPPFYVGYAHEACARAALVLGDVAIFRTHLEKARACATSVQDSHARDALERDLAELQEKQNRGAGRDAGGD